MYINRHFRFEQETKHFGYFWEPLPTTAPPDAKPYCCYISTVIFYQEYYAPEIDRVETQWNLLGERWTNLDLGWSSLAPFVWNDGTLYELTPGKVVYQNGQWWMRHGAYKVPRDDRRLRYLEVPYWTWETRRRREIGT